MDAPYTPESKPVCGHTRPSGEPPNRLPPHSRRPGRSSPVLAGRVPSATIASRSARENRRCLPTKQHGTRRSAAARRNHDSRTCNTSAACAGVNNNLSLTTTPPNALHPDTPELRNIGPKGTPRSQNSQTKRLHPERQTASRGHARLAQGTPSPVQAMMNGCLHPRHPNSRAEQPPRRERHLSTSSRSRQCSHRTHCSTPASSSTKPRNAACPSPSTTCKTSTPAARCSRSSA